MLEIRIQISDAGQVNLSSNFDAAPEYLVGLLERLKFGLLTAPPAPPGRGHDLVLARNGPRNLKAGG